MYHFFARISFVVGIILGIFLAFVTVHFDGVKKVTNRAPFHHAIHEYQSWFQKKSGVKRETVLFDELRYSKKNKYSLESNYLYEQVKIMCIVLMKQPSKERVIEDTWSKSCNYLKFINLAKSKKKFPSIKNLRNQTSWTLLCKVLFQVPDDVKWLLVVNDYTFVIVENLRFFIASLNHLEAYYFGHPVSSWGIVYNTGRAGYTFSRGTLLKLKQKLDSIDGCENKLLYNNKEDLYLGRYFASLNITVSDTRDHEGLSTFHPNNLYHLFSPLENQYQYSIYPVKCCSRYSITFQSIDSDKMYTYHYLLYKLQLFYSGYLGNKPKSTKNDDKIWKEFLREQDLPFNMTADQYYQTWVALVDDPATFSKHFKPKPFFDYN